MSSERVPSVYYPIGTSPINAEQRLLFLHDRTYDNPWGGLLTVAFSDGEFGPAERFPTFGSLPEFPHIGGAAEIAGWNLRNCGTCWELTYTNAKGVKKSISVLAIDHAGAGFNLSLSAMNELTGNQAIQLGRVEVASRQVDASVCGL